MAVEMEGRVFVVGRSRTAALDIGAALAALGGGGHPQAASAIVRGSSLEAVERDALAALPAGADAGAAGSGRDVVAALVRRATRRPSRRRWRSAAAAGRRACRSSRDGMLIGAADREDLGRAIAHGLAHAPVRAVMTAHVDAVAAGASLAELQRALLHSRHRPRAGHRRPAAPARTRWTRVLGVVTRGDLRRALRERSAEPRRRRRRRAGRAAGRAARPGGPVGRRPRRRPRTTTASTWWAAQSATCCWASRRFDVDIAVEGDGIAFARDLAAAAGRPRPRAREVPHGGGAGRRPARRRRHRPHGALRAPGGAAGGRARVDPARPAPPRLHDQRDGRRSGCRSGSAGWSTRSAAPRTWRAASAAGAPQPLLHRGPDPDLPGHPLREPLRLRDGRPRPASWRGPASRWGWSARCPAPGCATSWWRSCPRPRSAAPCAGCASSAWTPRCTRRCDCGDEAVALIGRIDDARRELAPGGCRSWQLRLAAISAADPRRRAGRAAGAAARAPPRRAGGRRVAAVCAAAGRAAGRGRASRARVGELLDAHPVEVAVRRRRIRGRTARPVPPRLYLARAARRAARDRRRQRCATSWGCPSRRWSGEILAELLRRRRNGELGAARRSWRPPASWRRRRSREAGSGQRQPLARAARATTRPGTCAPPTRTRAPSAWIRLGFTAPLADLPAEALAEVWFVGRDADGELYARRETFAIDRCRPAPAAFRSRSAAACWSRPAPSGCRGRGRAGT